MNICPVCQRENPDGATICNNCFAPLGKMPVQDEPTRDVKIQSVPKPTHVRYMGLLSRNALAFFIDGKTEPLILEVTTQAVLGRLVPDARQQPRVDLSPYGGFEKGVSRMHAIIRAADNGFVIEDLGSSNGTRLNGISLMPYDPKPLQPGDQLLLGKLELEILFRRGD
ncbi:MAG TPA: FHA domain-containing protein [Aggregatilineales bacterium]|nr:FHA domain-containing protein [Aggregatilineales bacterium]